MLGKQLDEMQAGKQEMVVKYEEQLQHVKDEVRSAFILAIVVVVHITVTHIVFVSNAVWRDSKKHFFFISTVNSNSFQQLYKLKRSYEKLQRKHLKEAREGALSREEDRTEMSLLNSKMEVQRLAKYKVDFIVCIRII